MALDRRGPIKSFHVYCTWMADNASPARDYLELAHNEDNGWPARNISTFAKYGYLGNGSATVSSDHKQANVTGGGFCGGYGPSAGELTLEQD